MSQRIGPIHSTG